MRDIEASVNSFFNSLSSNFNMAGYTQETLKEYVPALVYTMYDGYYIYSPYNNTEENGEKTYGLKPYIYYSCRYKRGNDDFVITYSLDNYITIQGIINNQSVFDYGYLLNNVDNLTYSDSSKNNPITASYRGIPIGTEILQEYGIEYTTGSDGRQIPVEKLYTYTKINGVKYYKDQNSNNWFSIMNGERYKQNTYKEQNDSALRYYDRAKKFTDRVLNTYNLRDLSTSNAVDENGNSLSSTFGNYEIFEYDNNTSLEEPNSNFNQHRLAVIRHSIERNLSVAIANYNNYSGVKANFQMPMLKEDEWEKILNNVSIISFMQGLNIGGKLYNGYSIITNTKNEEVVNENAIYIVTNDGPTGTYHKATDQDLVTNYNGITSGILNINFERKSLTGSDSTNYFFPNKAFGCYSSIVTQTNVDDTENIYDYMEQIYKSNSSNKLPRTYFTALGRERYSMYKTNNNSTELQKEFIQ